MLGRLQEHPLEAEPTGFLELGRPCDRDPRLQQPLGELVPDPLQLGEIQQAKAVLANGLEPAGTFTVHITSTPPQEYVNGNGQVVTTG